MSEQTQQKSSRSDIAKEYKKVFSHCPLVLADLEAFCHGDNTSFVPGDSHATSFNEGARAVLNRIKYFIRIDPKQLDVTTRG